MSTRNEAVDFFRGIGLWIVYIDHLSPSFLAQYTPWQFGFSDFAEMFVFLSGYIGIESYRRAIATEDGGKSVVKKLLSRMRRLYIAHLVSLVLSLLLLAYFAHRGLRIDSPTMYLWMAKPFKYLAGLLALLYIPHPFALLPLYVFMAPFLPLAAAGLQRAPKRTLALSGALWLTVQLTGLNLPSMHQEWHFNPFAWQFLYVLGGAVRHYAARLQALPRPPWLIAGSALIVAGAALVKTMHFAGLDSWHMVNAGKAELVFYRPVHFLALFILIAPFFSTHRDWLKSRIARVAIACGRDSLFIYAVSLIVDTAGSLALAATRGGRPLQVAISLGGIAFLCTLAWFRRELNAKHQGVRPSTLS